MKAFKMCKCGALCQSGYCQQCRDKDRRAKELEKIAKEDEKRNARSERQVQKGSRQAARA